MHQYAASLACSNTTSTALSDLYLYLYLYLPNPSGVEAEAVNKHAIDARQDE